MTTKKIRLRIRDMLANFNNSKTLLRNFIKLMLVMFLIIFIITLFIYSHSRQIIQEELLHTNVNLTQSTTNSMDNLIMEMRYVTATLGTNKMVQFYFSSESSASIFNGFYERIQEQLTAYVNGFDYIDSIYLYSPKNKGYIDIYGQHSIATITDAGWLDVLPGMTQNIAVIPRKVNGLYPYVLTILNKINVDGNIGMVVLNLDLHKLTNTLGSGDAEVSNTYIITNKSEVLFRKKQNDLFEDIALFSELSSFHANTAVSSTMVEGGNQPYIFTQIPSKDYDWNYVTVTYLQEYLSRLSSLRAIIITFLSVMLVLSIGLAFFFSMSFYKPIQHITNLLKSPENWDAAENKSEKDVKEIAEKIVSYVQTNNQLSLELKSRLNLLNETRIWALQSQINPHFISNTLNLIHLLILESPSLGNKASKMIVYLGKILHFALEPTSLVTLESEQEYTKLFLAILNERYDDNEIKTSFAISPDAASAKIPKLILQPLIENSVYHGMEKQMHADLSITITGSIKDGTIKNDEVRFVVLKIEDNGLGISEDTLVALRESISIDAEPSGQHIGLKNVAMRLRLLFGDAADVQIESPKNRGTCITLTFPYIP